MGPHVHQAEHDIELTTQHQDSSFFLFKDSFHQLCNLQPPSPAQSLHSHVVLLLKLSATVKTFLVICLPPRGLSTFPNSISSLVFQYATSNSPNTPTSFQNMGKYGSKLHIRVFEPYSPGAVASHPSPPRNLRGHSPDSCFLI